MMQRRGSAILIGLFLVTNNMVVMRLPAADVISFEQHVRPVLKAYCLDCHGAGEKLEGNLDLRLKRFAERGGDSGPAIVAGNGAGSLLIKRLRSGEMPPGEKKVPPEKIAIIEQWLAAGAVTAREEPPQLPPGIDITPEERAYWAFQPVRRVEPTLTTFAPTDRVRTAIDAFMLNRLREKSATLAFAPDADKRTLVHRVAFDLTGLPPTQSEIDQFLADTSDPAYEAMIDRYLGSPHYGERWARHWLDVAGYADSEGNGNEDTLRPFAYKFRDYVIRSFNADKPLSQFLIEQLAGDELVPQPWNNLQPEQIEQLVATGYLRNAVDGTATGGVDELLVANQVVADTLKIVSTSLLGLSVGCAQCHDHRYDPIPQSDYYRLRAIFEPALDPLHWRRPVQRNISLYTDADRANAAAIEAAAQQLQQALNEKTNRFLAEALEKVLLKFPEDQRGKLREAYQAPADKRTEEQKQLLNSNPSVNINAGNLYQYNEAAANEIKKDQEQIAAKRGEKKVEDFVSVLHELPGSVVPTHLFHRGDHRQPKQAVLPGDLTIAAPEGQRFEIAVPPPANPPAATSGRRLAFAKHLTSGSHPLVGRVLANRIWLNHFGRGLVDTPAEFGVLGQRPTHPELLDWLADELVRCGWRMKQLHKTIMLSTTYRQSSQHQAEHDAIDSENQLYGHFPVRRLDGESVRDRILAASGRLDRTQFGPAIPVEEDFVGQAVAKGDAPRRSIYLQNRRSKPVSFLMTFDSPVMTVNCERRISSTVAPQSLMLMNNDFVLKHAGLLAQRVRTEMTADFAKEIVGPLASKLRRPSEAWQFGYGSFDETNQRVAGFTAMPHFTGSSWQGSAALPDPQLGYVIHHAQGGHAGNDAQHATIRRWVASHQGTITVTGKLHHPSENGDGVRGRIVSSRSGVAGSWNVKNGEVATDAARVDVQPGDTLDFVIDCLDNVNSDSFNWSVRITDVQQPQLVWDSVADFHGPLGMPLPAQIAYTWHVVYGRPITVEELELAGSFVVTQLHALRSADPKADYELAALTNLCQQLISSNEFLYVD